MNKESKNKVGNSEKSPQNYKNYIALSVIGVITAWALTFLLYFIINDSDERGQFGDMFGAVNALFSGLAFAGLIITLILQREELSLQRDELKQTREEFEDQNKTMKRQRFENTFFNLMSLHQDITDNIEYKYSAFVQGVKTVTFKGRDVFKHLYQESSDNVFGIGLQCGDKKLLNSHYFDTFNHYLNFFEGILRFIDESDLLEDIERQQYAIMLRNTLSDYERYTIFYFFVAHGSWHKDKAEKYGLFYGMKPFGIEKIEHYYLFDSCAYEYNGRM